MIYFDHCASSPLLPSILDEWQSVASQNYANPASPHVMGIQSKKLLDAARSRIAAICAVPPGAIYFTSGATESANTIIKGYGAFIERTQPQKKEMIISAIEHPAVLRTVDSLKQQGWVIHKIGVDENGLINEDELIEAISDKTALVGIICVNNEIGTIQDIERISQKVKLKNHHALFMVDAAQALGKTHFSFDTNYVDAFFVSGQKIGAPRGTGLFYLNPKFRLIPLLNGGGQESGYRSGTNDVVGAHLISLALEENQARVSEQTEHVRHLKQFFLGELKKHNIRFLETISSEFASPYILSVIFPDLQANKIIQVLSEHHICVAGGSACSSSCHARSHVIEALQKYAEYQSNIVRISFGSSNTEQETAKLASTISKCFNNDASVQVA